MQEERRSDGIELGFGVAVRIRRKELGISQEALADRAGLNRTYIGDVERGERNISLRNVDKIARALEIPVSDLFIRNDM